MATDSQTSLAGYNPLAPFKPDRRVGWLTVKGNDSFSTVCNQGILVPVAIHIEDNGDDVPAGQPASAFERAVAWAAANQDKARPAGLIG